MRTTAKRMTVLLMLLLMMLTASLVVSQPPSVASGQTFRQSGSTGSEDERTGKTPAQPGAQPWMAALVDADEPNVQEGQFCGASLIAPRWVLTAAHCVEDQSPASVDVVVGRYQLSSDQGERIGAKRIIPHPGYVNEQDGQANDIALIELSRSATAGQPISIIGAANAAVDDPGVLARIAGWGRVPEKNLEVTDQLYSVDVPVVAPQACQAAYDGDIQIDELCAGLPQGGADSCEGDSGGPLFVPKADGKAVQIGIVSWGGDGCGLPQSYGVYTRLTEYEGWIKGQMGATSVDPAPVATSTPQPSSPSGLALIDPANIALPAGYALIDAQNKRGEREAYFETQDGDYVDVSVFDADYASLAEWMAEEGGEAAGQIVQVRGVPVSIEDGSDRYGPFWYSTFVVDGQLVFIDGVLTYDELLAAAASLID